MEELDFLLRRCKREYDDLSENASIDECEALMGRHVEEIVQRSGDQDFAISNLFEVYSPGAAEVRREGRKSAGRTSSVREIHILAALLRRA